MSPSAQPGSDDGRRLLAPSFPGDDGSADETLRAAMAACHDAAPDAAVLVLLQQARVLVPVVAVLGESEIGPDGLEREKSSDMAAVMVTSSSGRPGLLAFTGLDALIAWDPGARPVPVTAQLAAQAAVQQGAGALVVDIAGPATVVVQGDDLAGLAAGWRLARVGERTAWIAPAPGDDGDAE